MAISISRYVNISSAILGQAIIGTRQLILNLVTVNPLLPPQIYATFSSANEVGLYFGFTSEEYYRASSNYFNFVSKNNTTPGLIQFTRWAQNAVAGFIQSFGADTTLADWKTITTGSLGLTIGTHTFQLSSLDFSTAVALGTVTPVALTGTIDGSTAVITGLSSTALLVPGMVASGTGVFSGSTILTIDSSTQVTLSHVTTAPETEVITFTATTVASILQVAIRAESGGGTDWTSATVTYANNNFTITGGVIGAEAVAVQAGATGIDISGHTRVTAQAQFGFLPQLITANGVLTSGALWSPGSAAETISQTLTNTFNVNNNFGTFAFCYNQIPGISLAATISAPSTTVAMTSTTGLVAGMFVYGIGIAPGSTIVSIVVDTSIVVSLPTVYTGSFQLLFSTNAGLSLAQYQQAAEWNAALVPNFQLKLTVPVSLANASTFGTAYPVGLGGIEGVNVALTDYVAPVSATSQYPEQSDSAIEAATDYSPSAINSVQNYMFQLFPTLTPLVSSDSVANSLDGFLINYIGLTQNAGQQISFYQRGILQSGTDSGVYANEQWLKSAITASIMNLLLAQSYVAANNQGLSQIQAIMQSVIQQALQNGTISVGKVLTALQIASITAITGNANAWQQVQNVGYFLTVVIQPDPDHIGQYEAVYTLVYSKNDVIRFVKGTDDLI